jgi:hypothetical protein
MRIKTVPKGPIFTAKVGAYLPIMRPTTIPNTIQDVRVRLLRKCHTSVTNVLVVLCFEDLGCKRSGEEG